MFQLVLGILFLRRGKMLPGALMAGKVCTTVLFVSLILLVLIPEMSYDAVTFIAAVDTIFLMFSFISYALAYLGVNARIQDVDSE